MHSERGASRIGSEEPDRTADFAGSEASSTLEARLLLACIEGSPLSSDLRYQANQHSVTAADRLATAWERGLLVLDDRTEQRLVRNPSSRMIGTTER